MISYIAVVFFCLAEGDCYFWSGKTLHTSDTACQRELDSVVKALEERDVPSAFQCIKVPLVGV
jgi:hypothetical protein